MINYLEADKIYPKRIGIYKGNNLVIEYYNFAEDKFSKHKIPFNAADPPQKIIQTILKNPKNSALFRKVDSRHLKSIL